MSKVKLILCVGMTFLLSSPVLASPAAADTTACDTLPYVKRSHYVLFGAGGMNKDFSLNYVRMNINLYEQLRYFQYSDESLLSWKFYPVFSSTIFYAGLRSKYGSYHYYKGFKNPAETNTSAFSSFQFAAKVKRVIVELDRQQVTGMYRKGFTDATPVFMPDLHYNHFGIQLAYDRNDRLANPLFYVPKKSGSFVGGALGYRQVSMYRDNGDFIPLLYIRGRDWNPDSVGVVNGNFINRFVSKGGTIKLDYDVVWILKKMKDCSNPKLIYFQLSIDWIIFMQGFRYDTELKNDGNQEYDEVRKGFGMTSSRNFYGNLCFDRNRFVFNVFGKYTSQNFGKGGDAFNKDLSHLDERNWYYGVSLYYRVDFSGVYNKLSRLREPK